MSCLTQLRTELQRQESISRSVVASISGICIGPRLICYALLRRFVMPVVVRTINPCMRPVPAVPRVCLAS